MAIDPKTASMIINFAVKAAPSIRDFFKGRAEAKRVKEDLINLIEKIDFDTELEKMKAEGADLIEKTLQDVGK